jgi:hypothetical protein
MNEWMNVGGQLIPVDDVNALIKNVKANKVKSWDDLHKFYTRQADEYSSKKLQHAMATWREITGTKTSRFNKETFVELLQSAVKTKEWMMQGIYDSRAKDYSNPFRKMVYENQAEMDAVIGKLDDNSFINEQREELKKFKKQIAAITKKL